MKRIIITWVSEWLWLEIAKVYLENWYEVIGISRNKPNLNIIHLKTDLTQEEDIEKTTKIIKDKYWDFEVLINCAWMMIVEELEELSYTNTEKLMKLNVIAPMIFTSKLMKNIKKNSSDIVNVASTVGTTKSCKKQCAYSASKIAVKWITENFQLELKESQSRVMGFNIWWFKSAFFEKATWIKVDLSKFMNAQDIAQFIKQILDLPKNMEVSEIVINRK